ncbi:hypothetical protein HPP92_016239 [Vanilla planifolia]|uniref:Uncharacterized protein n=1 Tax=Vanilla planifolia TaxID=51239 RepID=A0A835QNA2_VANPL|nr:hypothetical protein HPP92_016239 [Vanilla planifolia]
MVIITLILLTRKIGYFIQLSNIRRPADHSSPGHGCASFPPNAHLQHSHSYANTPAAFTSSLISLHPLLSLSVCRHNRRRPRRTCCRHPPSPSNVPFLLLEPRTASVAESAPTPSMASCSTAASRSFSPPILKLVTSSITPPSNYAASTPVLSSSTPDASTVSPIHSAAHLTPSPLSSIPLAHQSTRSLSASTVFAPLFLLFASHPPSKSPSPTASVPSVSPLPSSIAFSALSLRGYSLIPIFLPLLASLTSSSSVLPPATTLFPPAASEPFPLSSQQIYHRHSSACVPRSFP